MRKVLVNNELVEAEAVPVVKGEERTSDYLLADGTVIKLRVFITSAFKVVGKQDATGLPVYSINWYVVPIVEPPEEE